MLRHRYSRTVRRIDKLETVSCKKELTLNSVGLTHVLASLGPLYKRSTLNASFPFLLSRKLHNLLRSLILGATSLVDTSSAEHAGLTFACTTSCDAAFDLVLRDESGTLLSVTVDPLVRRYGVLGLLVNILREKLFGDHLSDCRERNRLLAALGRKVSLGVHRVAK
jgi:hypothetical protein